MHALCIISNIKYLPTGFGKLEVNLECERPDVEIRYTEDGSEPTSASTLYTQPFGLTESATVKGLPTNGDRRWEKP